MAPIARVKIRWSGTLGSPGFSVLHFREFPGDAITQAVANGAVARTDTFVDAVRGSMPTVVRVRVETQVEEIEETTGTLLNVFTTTPLAERGGQDTATTGWSGASGAVVTWRTNVTRNGRRVRGRTFLVPLAAAAYQNDGTLAANHVTVLNDAAAALAAGTGTPDLGIWARPTPILDVNGQPTGNYNPDGAWFAVSSGTVPDMAAVLRSRRD